eukprot:SAG22_NODE_11681_length_474_cov_0.824000_1_plen_118_part_00
MAAVAAGMLRTKLMVPVISALNGVADEKLKAGSSRVLVFMPADGARAVLSKTVSVSPGEAAVLGMLLSAAAAAQSRGRTEAVLAPNIIAIILPSSVALRRAHHCRGGSAGRRGRPLP